MFWRCKEIISLVMAIACGLGAPLPALSAQNHALAPNSLMQDKDNPIEKSRRILLELIRQRVAQGLSVLGADVRRADRILYNLASNLYKNEGGWAGAVRAAGIMPQEPVGMPAAMEPSAKEQVLLDIQERERQGKSLRATDVSLVKAGESPKPLAVDGGKIEGLVHRNMLSRQRSGQRMDEATVRKDNPYLYLSATLLYDNWYAAMAAVGIAGDSVDVVGGIKRRIEKGQSLKSEDVKRDDRKLHKSALNQYTNWNEALGAAGLSKQEIRDIHAVWPRDRVLREIQAREKRGEALNSVAVFERNRPLYEAGKKIFAEQGGWYGAVRAAGFTVGGTENKPGPKSRSIRRSREDVLQDILARYRGGRSLLAMDVKGEDESLLSAAESRFRKEGGWYGALEAAGLTEQKILSLIEQETERKRAEIVDALRRRESAGLSLEPGIVHKEDNALSKKIYKYFKKHGVWKGALRAMGKDDSEIARIMKNGERTGIMREDRSKQRLLKKLLERYQTGQSIVRGEVERSLYVSVLRKWKGPGAWERALKEAGIPEKAIPARKLRIKKNWDRALVLSEIQAWRAAGGSLALSDVREKHVKLYVSASKLFKDEGGWYGAVLAADVSPAEIAAAKQQRRRGRRRISQPKAVAQPSGAPAKMYWERDAAWPYAQFSEVDLHKEGQRLRGILGAMMPRDGKLSLAKAMENAELQKAGPLVVLLLVFDLVNRGTRGWDSGSFVVDVPALGPQRSLPIVWSAFHHVYGEQPTTLMLSALYGYEKTDESIQSLAEILEDLYGWKYQRIQARGRMKRFERLKNPFLSVYDPLIAAKAFLQSVVEKFAEKSPVIRGVDPAAAALVDAAA